MNFGITHKRSAQVSAAVLALASLGFASTAFAADEHAGHDMSKMAAPVDDPHAGHDMSKMAAPAVDPHAHHHLPDSKAAVKRSIVEIAPAATPMVKQDGSKTTLAKELEGKKPTILAFIYTSCTTVCPVTSQILSGTQDKLGGDLANTRIISVSIDPEYDTPERLVAYAKQFGAKPQWQHYTGTLTDSVAIQKTFGAYRGDKMNHVPLMFINGGGKKEWVKLDGFPSADEVVKEYRNQVKG